MSEHDEFKDVAYVEVTLDGVVHQMPITPEQARRWAEEKEAIGFARGEPFADQDGRLIEHHGLPHDSRIEPVEPEVLGVPVDPQDWEAHDHDADDDAYPDEL